MTGVHPSAGAGAASRPGRARILWLIKGLGLGGAERLLLDALPLHDRERFEIEVAYLLPHKDLLAGELERLGVPVHCLGMRSNLAAAAAVPTLRRLLRERRIDLAHAHLPMAGVVARLATRGTGLPVVYTEHSLQERYHPAMQVANRLTYRMNARVLAVSGGAAQSLRARRMDRGVRVEVVPNGVPVAAVLAEGSRGAAVRSELGIAAAAAVVGTVTVFRAVKRLGDWIEVARRVCAQRSDVVFLLAGDGPEMPQVRRAAQASGLGGRLLLPGFRADGRAILGAVDIFLLTSAFEGLPLALLEAMALGRPVVATAVGGVPEAVTDGVEGFVRGAADVEALAQAVLRLLGDKDLCRRMGEHGRAAVAERYSLERVVRTVEAVYAQVLNQGGRW